MRALGPRTWLIDVRFQGHAEYIGTYVLETAAGIVLVDPGPTSTLAALDEGLRLHGLATEAITHLLLTHIHLDHAGAAGTLVKRHPGIRVAVHRRGARHLVDPSRLLVSATRLYGDQMDTLWGEFLAVPEANVDALEGGESIDLGGRRVEVAYTPGHAVHHVSYFEPDIGFAFVGDTAGIRIDNRPFVLPVTPPPDIDMEAWRVSMARIRAWKPDVICPTHFGPARPAREHLDEHDERLEAWAEAVREDLATGEDDAELARRFRERARVQISAHLDVNEAPSFIAGAGLDDSWLGLARYWRKRAARAQ